MRLARCNLLFRSHEVSGLLRQSLQTLLPFEGAAPFHHFMVRHCLANDLKSILEVYVIWYGLNKLPFDTFFSEYKKSAQKSRYVLSLVRMPVPPAFTHLPFPLSWRRLVPPAPPRSVTFPAELFQPTVTSALHMLDQSRTVRAGSTGASYSGQAVLASALAFPTQPVAMRKIVYQRLLDAFPHPSDAHALVEKGALCAVRGCVCFVSDHLGECPLSLARYMLRQQVFYIACPPHYLDLFFLTPHSPHQS